MTIILTLSGLPRITRNYAGLLRVTSHYPRLPSGPADSQSLIFPENDINFIDIVTVV